MSNKSSILEQIQAYVGDTQKDGCGLSAIYPLAERERQGRSISKKTREAREGLLNGRNPDNSFQSANPAEASYLEAVSLFLRGETDRAANVITNCLRQDEGNEAYIALAKTLEEKYGSIENDLEIDRLRNLDKAAEYRKKAGGYA